MARGRAKRTKSRAPAARSYSKRAVRNYSARQYKAPARATRRNTRRNVGRGQVIRIELVQPGSNPVARPDLIGKRPIVGLTRDRPRF